jgi:hypothetical protein
VEYQEGTLIEIAKSTANTLRGVALHKKSRTATVAAISEGVNELELSAGSPLLASPQGGVAERSRNIAKHPLFAKPGWFSNRNERKTTLASSVSVATRNYLMTQPPLLAVMQGGDYLRSIPIHSHLL